MYIYMCGMNMKRLYTSHSYVCTYIHTHINIKLKKKDEIILLILIRIKFTQIKANLQRYFVATYVRNSHLYIQITL